MTVQRPDTTIVAFNGKAPRIHDSAFIAPGCRIIGDVEIGPDVSVWYNCVLRGDASRIVIGAPPGGWIVTTALASDQFATPS